MKVKTDAERGRKRVRKKEIKTVRMLRDIEREGKRDKEQREKGEKCRKGDGEKEIFRKRCRNRERTIREK